MTQTHQPISEDRLTEIRVMLAGGDPTMELAMDASAIIGGLLAEMDRKDAVLLRQGRNIGQMAGDNDLLREQNRRAAPIVDAGLRWIASKGNHAAEEALAEALHELLAELTAAAAAKAGDN